jgi:2-amino-4-hydroxy-6-hydroxymethyldihydropteridine diphosphokinase
LNNHIYISLGSNLGDKRATIFNAYEAIENKIGSILSKSSLYTSEPWGFESEEFFINCVIEIETNLDASQTLNELHLIENSLGRVRLDSINYTDRNIDLDLLYFGDKIIETSFNLPHPRIYQRKFVLVPLAEIAPSFIDPKKKKTILELLTECEDDSFLTKSEL